MPDHRSELRHQLVAAARDQAAGGAGGPATRRVAPLLVAAALLVAVIVGGGMLRSERASAEVFDIQHQEDGSVVIDVIGPIQDPDAAAAELEELGFAVTVEGVPAPPSLGGHIVAVSVDPVSPSAVGPFLVTETEEQRVVQFRADGGSRGQVVIMYGRAAAPGELYMANDTIPDCTDYVGELVTDDLVERLAAEHGPSIRWKEIAGHQIREVGRDEIDDDARVVSAMGLASDRVLVQVTDGTEAPPGMSC